MENKNNAFTLICKAGEAKFSLINIAIELERLGLPDKANGLIAIAREIEDWQLGKGE